MMKNFRLINFVSLAVFGLAVLFAGSVDADAQNRRDNVRDRYRNDSRYDRQRRVRDVQPRSHNWTRREVNGVILQGYENGLQAGRLDRSRGKFNASNVYRNTPARPYSGDTSSTDYLYRQGYLEGYQDGYSGRIRY